MIQRIRKEDIDEITSLFEREFHVLYKEDEFSTTYVYKEKEILGFIQFSVIYERIELNYIYVKEEYRKKHIASLLLEEMFQVPNIESISLEVSVLNEAAIQLYLKHGFKVVSLRKAYYDGVDAYLMVKDMVV